MVGGGKSAQLIVYIWTRHADPECKRNIYKVTVFVAVLKRNSAQIEATIGGIHIAGARRYTSRSRPS